MRIAICYIYESQYEEKRGVGKSDYSGHETGEMGSSNDREESSQERRCFHAFCIAMSLSEVGKESAARSTRATGEKGLATGRGARILSGSGEILNVTGLSRWSVHPTRQ